MRKAIAPLLAVLVLGLGACGDDRPAELHQLDGIEDTLVSPLPSPRPTPEVTP